MARHQDLDEANMHEPKHMTTATAGAGDIGKVNVSKGDGSTEVRKLVPVEVGIPQHYGQLTMSNNAVAQTVPLAVDVTLATNTDYVQVLNNFDAIPHGVNVGVTQQANSLTANITGDYKVHLWADVASTINSTTVAFKFAVDGTISLTRRPKNFMRNAGEFHNTSAFGFVPLTAGQVITLHMASDKAADITIEDAVFDLILISAT